MSPATVSTSNITSNTLSGGQVTPQYAQLMRHNGLYDWKSVVEGDRESYFLKCGVPWLARKLLKYMFTQFRVNIFWNKTTKVPAVDLQVRSRLGMNGYLTFVADGKIHVADTRGIIWSVGKSKFWR